MAATGAGLPLTNPVYGAGHKAAEKIKICVFSKHLQWLDYRGMAETAAEIGFDGVALTVRATGHVLPERVEEDMPRAVEAVNKAGLKVYTMTTRINDPEDGYTERILKTASELGVKYYRMGAFRYDDAILWILKIHAG